MQRNFKANNRKQQKANLKGKIKKQQAKRAK